MQKTEASTMTEQSYTGANLQKEGQALTSLSVQPHRTVLGSVGSEITGREEVKQINVTGEFEVTVKNTGILPVFNASVHISELSLAGVTVLEDETKSLTTMSGGQENTATFTFDVVSDRTSFVDTMRQLCGDSIRQVSYELEGTTGGFVIGTSIESSGTIAPGSKSCNLPTAGDGGSDQPGNGDGSEDGDDGDGGDNGDGGIIGGGPADSDFVIDGPDRPPVGEQVSYSMVNQGEPLNADLKQYYWFIDGEQIDVFGQTIEWRFAQGEEGSHTIRCEVQDGWSESTLDSATKEVNVQPGEPELDVRLEGPSNVTAGDREDYVIVDSSGETLEPEYTYDWRVDGDMVRESNATYTHIFTEEDAGLGVTIECDIEEPGAADSGRLAHVEMDIDVESDVEDQGGEIEGPTSVDVGEEASYTFSKAPGDYGAWTVGYEWDVDGDSVDSGQNCTHTFNDPGEATLTCMVKDQWTGEYIDRESVRVDVGGGVYSLSERSDLRVEKEHSTPSMSEAAQQKDT